MTIPAIDLYGEWRDDDLATVDALGVLKLNTSTGGPDFAALRPYAVEAGDLIVLELDRRSSIPGVIPGNPPPVLRGAHRDVTVELYQRRNAPHGVLNAWSSDLEPVRISSDPLRGVRSRISSYREQWGVA